jgi:hypothetical protein
VLQVRKESEVKISKSQRNARELKIKEGVVVDVLFRYILASAGKRGST